MPEREPLLLRQEEPAGAPVYLNVYDLTPYNSLLHCLGLGMYHSGIEVHGVEYCFGYHDQPSSGVFEVEPHLCPGFTFRTSVKLGMTDMGPLQVRLFMERVASEYSGDSYHLLLKNCNHFNEDMSLRLTNEPVPGWVNRMARIGWMCRCFLPDIFRVPTVEYLEHNGDVAVEVPKAGAN